MAWVSSHFRHFHDQGDLLRPPGEAAEPSTHGAGFRERVLDSDDPVIIHALPLRAKFYRFLR